METVSPENTSPLIVRCRGCGHQEHAEVQVVPPWPAQPVPGKEKRRQGAIGKKKRKRSDSLKGPVSDGASEKETVLPFGWILLWGMLVGIVLVIMLLVQT